MKNNHTIIIVGAGVAGQELVTELRRQVPGHYDIVGFVDDDPSKQQTEIMGIPVLGTRDQLPEILKNHSQEIEEVFIAIPSAQSSVIRDVIFKCREVGVNFRIVPRLLEIIQGQVKLNQVRDVQIEDLLGRTPVQSEQSTFLESFVGKRILVTGAAGSIGSELCRQLSQFKPELLVAVDWWENGIFELDQELQEISQGKFQCMIGSVQNKEKLEDIFKQTKPQIVFHAAAYKHVPLMEQFPEEGVVNNIFGTENVAAVALAHNVEKFVLISTDKAVDSTNVMGTTKAVAEKVIRLYNSFGSTHYMAVRFGNVLGSNGSVVHTFRKQISKGGPVTVTDPNVIRYFMTIPEAVQLVLQASILGQGGEVFILKMGEQMKIADLARLMITLSGYVPEKEIKIEYTGLRPGEKMYEELKTNEEMVGDTAHPSVYKVERQTPEQIEEIKLLIDQFHQAIDNKNHQQVMKLLHQVSPHLQQV